MLSSLLALLFGVGLGSLFALFARQLPSRLDELRTLSRCASCEAPLSLADAVPLLGFFLLDGRCRRCKRPISWAYPVAEGVTGLFVLLAVRHFLSGAVAGVALLFGLALILLALIDFHHTVLPDALTLPGIVVGLLCQPLIYWVSGKSAVLGALAGAGLLLAANELGQLMRGAAGIGLGDVKMMAMIGAFVGLPGVVVTLTVAAPLAGAAFLALRLGGSAPGRRLPFGVFLAVGGIVAFFIGPDLLWTPQR